MVTARELVAALKRAGFQELRRRRTAGSHLHLWHPEKRLLTTVPMHPGAMSRGLVKEILRQAGLSEAEFRELL